MDKETKEAFESIQKEIAGLKSSVGSSEYGLAAIAQRIGRLEKWVHDLDDQVKALSKA
jgi:prefoldin subunit 5